MTQPWTEFLTRTGAEITDQTVHFPQGEGGDSGCVAVPLLHLGLIRSFGEGSTEFLHNLLSNDVKHLSEDGAQWSSLNTPKGRMLASLLLYREIDGHGIVVAADIAAAILRRMSMYVLRSKVKLASAEADFALIGVTGAGAGDVLTGAGLTIPAAKMSQTVSRNVRCIRLDGDNFVLVAPCADAPDLWTQLGAAGASAAGTDRWHLAMIRAGIPLVTAATQEEFVPQMLNFEIIGGVSFSKGCYPGQEIVARTQYLGKLKKRMFRVQLPAGTDPKVGDDVHTPEFGEQSAGKLVNVAPTPGGGFEALAVMQTGCAADGEAYLGDADSPRLEFLPLPYELA